MTDTKPDDTESVSDEFSNDDYDSPWKDAVEHYFPELMAFYFPMAYAEIDWSKEHVFLDQELRAIVQDAELGKRYVDKLVRVILLTGDENWIYIHIEVQGSQQAEFAKRMFVYNYRIYDRFDRPVASMAVLADENKHWKPTAFGFEVLGCQHSLTFPVAKLTDYADRVDELLAIDNAFALITAAHILTQRTRKESQARYEAKLRLVRLLYERQWDKQRIIDLFEVVDWLMKLPKWLETKIFQEIESIERREDMRYINSVQRMYMEKFRAEGMELGIEQGVEIGLVKGVVTGEAKLLKKQLEKRFGSLPSWAITKLESAAEEELETWGEAILTADTLHTVFGGDTTH